jgi:hypothetical protein
MPLLLAIVSLRKGFMDEEKKPLWEEIVDFTKSKNKLAVSLIAIGLLGLVLPILPGLLLVAVGVYLLKPEWADKVKELFK